MDNDRLYGYSASTMSMSAANTVNYRYNTLCGQSSSTGSTDGCLINGATYEFSCESSVVNSYTSSTKPTQYAVLVYNFKTQSIGITNILNFSSSKQSVTFTVPSTGYWSLLIYAGKNGSTNGNNVTYNGIKVKRIK